MDPAQRRVVTGSADAYLRVFTVHDSMALVPPAPRPPPPPTPPTPLTTHGHVRRGSRARPCKRMSMFCLPGREQEEVKMQGPGCCWPRGWVALCASRSALLNLGLCGPYLLKYSWTRNPSCLIR